MADAYVDLDAGSDANSGADWANAEKTVQAGLTGAGAGGTCYVRRTDSGTPGVDTASGSRTLTSPSSSILNPTRLIGVKDGTTAEPPAASDIAVRGTDTLPVFAATGIANLTCAGACSVFGMKINASWSLQINTSNVWVFDGSELVSGKEIITSNGATFIWNDCEVEFAGTNASLSAQHATSSSTGGIYMYGGKILFTSAPTVNGLFKANLIAAAPIELTGVDLSGLGNNTMYTTGSAQAQGPKTLRNCSLPATFTRLSGTPTGYSPQFKLELIGCSSVTSVANTSSIQDYVREDMWGTIELETTKVRTGGADDGAAGGFSYKMSPRSNSVLEGSSAKLTSPWMSVWVSGGSSKTLTIHIANDGAGDLNEDEVWSEFFTPDAGDTAQHDQTFDPSDGARIAVSTTAVTDDTGSTWGGSVGNHQKMSVTVTPGFEGEVYARLHYAKRAFDVLYLDPKIAVS